MDHGAARASCWVASVPGSAAPPLREAVVRADVAVVGGGIVGVTTALLLAREGRSVVLLEAARIGGQVTGGSTAKITTQHGLVYGEIAARQGAAAAAVYAQSNSAASKWIVDQVRERSIECDLEICDAYLYTSSAERIGDLEREVAAVRQAGLAADLTFDVALPFPAQAAVRFPDQAQFHPVKYVDALGLELRSLGGQVYESTRVIDVDHGRPCKVVTEHSRVLADDVVIATHLPILDRGGYFSRAFPYRHMCVAARLSRQPSPAGMFLGVDDPTRSFRTAPWGGGERLLVAVGEAFATAQTDNVRLLEDIESFVRTHFGIETVEYRWGNQDYYTADRLPFIGALLPSAARIRVATGFNAWGITTGTVAAMILCDDILKRPNPWAALYDSRRLGVKGGLGKTLAKNAGIAKSWIAEHVGPGPKRTADSLAPGEGDVVQAGDAAVAVFRDAGGALHAVDPRCTHMGCQLRFNAAERSWDCHCHGSRFDLEGNVLNGPAVHPLASVEIGEK